MSFGGRKKASTVMSTSSNVKVGGGGPEVASRAADNFTSSPGSQRADPEKAMPAETSKTSPPRHSKVEAFWASMAISNVVAREFIAEFVGTFILVALGDGSVAQKVYFTGGGSFFTVNWGYGLAVAFGVFASARISGGHINPAVSTTMVALGKVNSYAHKSH